MSKFILKIIFASITFYLIARFFPNLISLKAPEYAFWAGLILCMINLLIKPLLFLLTLPINILTLGLFTLILDTWMILLTAKILPGVTIFGFGAAFICALVITALNILFRPAKEDCY